MTRIFTEIIGKNFLKTVRPYIELLTKSFSIFERIYYYESEVKGIQFDSILTFFQIFVIKILIEVAAYGPIPKKLELVLKSVQKRSILT